MSKVDHIQVSVRIKPMLDDQAAGKYCLHTELNMKDTIVLEVQGKQRYFSFDHVADENASQQDIFNHVGRPCVVQAIAGYNGCVFVYGQTGAGKTHTMIGSGEKPGVLPKALDFLYEQVSLDSHQNDSAEYLIKCSFLEIYNEHIIDLLNPSSGNLTLREDLNKGVHVEHLTEESCSSLGQAIQVLQRGNQNRHIASTSMNSQSSRSHIVFTVIIESKRQNSQTMVKNHRYARMHFVDLAGSERQKSTQTTGERQREGCNINKSLHILGNVINSLAELSSQQQQKFVHYRDSKLTFLLKDSLGGNSRTHLIANVHQGAQQYQESLSTLQFAKRVKQVRNKAHINEDDSGNLESLKSEIKRLKQDLAKKTIEHDFQFLTPQKDHTMVMQSHNFLQSLEAESLMMDDSKQIRLEELLKCYLEQSTETETSLLLQLEKSSEVVVDFRRLFNEGTNRELQLRLAVQLLNARLQKNGTHDDSIVNIHTTPIVFKVLQENFELKEMGGTLIPQSCKLLQQNLALLISIGDTIKESIHERRELQNQLEERIQLKYVSPNKYHDLESILEQKEQDHLSQLISLKQEIADMKLQKNQMENLFSEKDSQHERLKSDVSDLRAQITIQESAYESSLRYKQTELQDNESQIAQKLDESEKQNKKLEQELNRKKQEFERLIDKSQQHAREQADLMSELESQLVSHQQQIRDRDVSLQRISRDFEEGKSQNQSLQRMSMEMKQKLDTIVEQEIQELKTQLSEAGHNKDVIVDQYKIQIAFLESQNEVEACKLRQELDNLESTLQFQESQHSQTTSDLTQQIHSEHEQFETLRSIFTREQKVYKLSLDGVRSDLQERDEKLEEIKSMLQRQNQSLQRHRQQDSENGQSILELSQQVESLLEQKECSEKLITQEQHTKQCIQGEISDLNTELTELRKASKQYQCQLKHSQDMLSQKTQVVEGLEVIIKQLKEEDNSAAEQLRQHKVEQNRLEHRLAQMFEEQQLFKTQIQEFEQSTREQQNRIQDTYEQLGLCQKLLKEQDANNSELISAAERNQEQSQLQLDDLNAQVHEKQLLMIRIQEFEQLSREQQIKLSECQEQLHLSLKEQNSELISLAKNNEDHSTQQLIEFLQEKEQFTSQIQELKQLSSEHQIKISEQQDLLQVYQKTFKEQDCKNSELISLAKNNEDQSQQQVKDLNYYAQEMELLNTQIQELKQLSCEQQINLCEQQELLQVCQESLKELDAKNSDLISVAKDQSKQQENDLNTHVQEKILYMTQNQEMEKLFSEQQTQISEQQELLEVYQKTFKEKESLNSLVTKNNEEQSKQQEDKLIQQKELFMAEIQELQELSKAQQIKILDQQGRIQVCQKTQLEQDGKFSELSQNAIKIEEQSQQKLNDAIHQKQQQFDELSSQNEQLNEQNTQTQHQLSELNALNHQQQESLSYIQAEYDMSQQTIQQMQVELNQCQVEHQERIVSVSTLNNNQAEIILDLRGRIQTQQYVSEEQEITMQLQLRSIIQHERTEESQQRICQEQECTIRTQLRSLEESHTAQKMILEEHQQNLESQGRFLEEQLCIQNQSAQEQIQAMEIQFKQKEQISITQYQLQGENADQCMLSLQATICEQNDKIDEISTRMLEAEQQCLEMEEISSVQQRESKEQHSQLTKELTYVKNHLHDTQVTLDEATKSHDLQRQSVKLLLVKLQTDTQQYESTQVDLEDQILGLQNEISMYNKSLAQQEQEYNQQLKQMLDLSQANEDHLQDIYNNKLCQQKQIHDELIRKFNQEFEEERKTNKHISQQQLENIERQNFHLIGDVKERESSNKEMMSRLIQMQQQVATDERTNQSAMDEKHTQIHNLEQDLFENEQTLQKVHDKAKEFCRQQEREINEIKDQYMILEEEHNTIIDQNSQLQQENEQVIQELNNLQQVREQLKEEMKSMRQNDQKLKKENTDLGNKVSRMNQENQHSVREVESLQNEISRIMGHNNPAQKVRYLNSVKQENSSLKYEKHNLTEQLMVLADEKHKLSQKVRTQHVSPQRREDTDYDRVLQDNMRMQSEISKLNSILNIPSSKKVNANSQEVDRIISQVQRVIQELVDCKSALQMRDKDLEVKNLKHQALERDLLLLRQKQYTNQRENSLTNYHSGGETALRDNKQTGRKLTYQLQ